MGEVVTKCGDGIYGLKLYDHSLQFCCGESLWDLYGGTHLYEKAYKVIITRGALLMLFEDEDFKACNNIKYALAKNFHVS